MATLVLLVVIVAMALALLIAVISLLEEAYVSASPLVVPVTPLLRVVALVAVDLLAVTIGALVGVLLALKPIGSATSLFPLRAVVLGIETPAIPMLYFIRSSVTVVAVTIVNMTPPPTKISSSGTQC